MHSINCNAQRLVGASLSHSGENSPINDIGAGSMGSCFRAILGHSPLNNLCSKVNEQRLVHGVITTNKTLMKKILVYLAAFVTVVGLGSLILFRGQHIALAYAYNAIEKRDMAELGDMLLPAMVWRMPDPTLTGPGPYPLFVQMHGCGGLNMDQNNSYADIANSAGYAALIVSSNAPRGYDRKDSQEIVCPGKALLGQERAADIFVALNSALKRDDIDTTIIVLGGWSHGAWTVMDYLSLDREAGLPAGLTAYDGPRPTIKAAVLFYPYCAFGSRTRVFGWDQHPDVLAFMGTADSIVDYKECQAVFDKLEAEDINIERHLYTDAEHSFDNPHSFDDPTRYDAEKSGAARTKLAIFLKAQAR